MRIPLRPMKVTEYASNVWNYQSANSDAVQTENLFMFTTVYLSVSQQLVLISDRAITNFLVGLFNEKTARNELKLKNLLQNK